MQLTQHIGTHTTYATCHKAVQLKMEHRISYTYFLQQSTRTATDWTLHIDCWPACNPSAQKISQFSIQVSHDFLATSYNLPGISSSLHLTVEGGGEAYGDSVPAIYFHPHVCNQLNTSDQTSVCPNLPVRSTGCWWSQQWTACTTSTPMSHNTNHLLPNGPTLRFHRQFAIKTRVFAAFSH